ncbi:hypothetical protein lbkm_4151 [Lachnospiraceae bacterium KM106-2]|nr:hypothetical protein lbkm_4151 [Lachnospiraceae bacterium KM106-2]
MSLLLTSITTGVTSRAETKDNETATEVSVPSPYYEFTFDDGISDGLVTNTGSKSDVAKIGGKAKVEKDGTRNSDVLNLPGGSLNAGYLTLPDNMYGDVTDKGFAFSFWIDVDPSATHYNRIFSSSTQELNSNDGDGGRWNAPEFTFVVGGTDTASSRYNSSIMLSDGSSQAKLIWDESFKKGSWQHVTVSVTPESYDVYLDGKQIAMTDANSNLKTILGKLFAGELKNYKYNAIGRSIYTTDNDINAKIDDFRFFNCALSKNQAQAAYESYKIDETVMDQLEAKIKEVSAHSPSFYTEESYEALAAAITTAKTVYENPVTEANVKNTIDTLIKLEGKLVFYEGIKEEVGVSNVQLTDLLKKAEQLMEENYSSDSKKVLSEAIDSSKETLKEEEQKQADIDKALLALQKAIKNLSYGSSLKFDVTKNTGDMLHGSTGFLYGVSEVNVPSNDLLSAIQPKIMVQKAADGMQHPSGDAYRLTSYLKDAGVKNIQVYLQDYFLEWPYDYDRNDRIGDYKKKVEKIVTKMTEGKSESEKAIYSYVIFNEPDQIWYGTSDKNISTMCDDWLVIYHAIKKIDPKAKIAGPNFASFRESQYEKFFNFCKENNCLPDYITWHELSKSSLTNFQGNYNKMKQIIASAYQDSDIDPIVFINETVNFQDVGAPGPLVNWISLFEENKVYSSLPYWGLANSMNELAAESNQPNGAWWVYKWYADMQGYTIGMTKENIENPSSYGSLYGLSSVDEKNQRIAVLFGGQAGDQTIQMEQIKKLKMFQDQSAAHVKIYSTKYTGQQGIADSTPIVFEGNVDFVNGKLPITIQNAALMDAYYAIITPPTKEASISVKDYEKANWTKEYEAEDATLVGEAKAFKKEGGSDLARSNRAEVGNLNCEKDGIDFTVDVPKDGSYQLDVYYSSQASQVDPLTLQYVAKGGQNRAIGSISKHNLYVDGTLKQELCYESTVKWGYYKNKTVSLSLKKGKHTIGLRYKGEDQNGKEINSMLCALIDKIDLTYEAEEKQVVIEPEELIRDQKGFTFDQVKKDYKGAGYIKGSGDDEFTVVVPKDGYYKVDALLCGDAKVTLSKSSFQYAKDAKATSEVSTTWIPLASKNISGSEFHKYEYGLIYLTAGANKLKVHSEEAFFFDQLILSYDKNATEENPYTVEAEDCSLTSDEPGDDYNYLLGSSSVPKVISNTYASGQKAVEGFRGGCGNSFSLKINVSKEGNYKLSMVYANDEPAPVMKKQDGNYYVHPYNTDLVERYAQIQVNDQEKKTVYFRSTFCWDVFKNVVIDVHLKKGNNVIQVSNDNSYKYSSVQDDFTPRFDQFTIAQGIIEEGKAEKIQGSLPEETQTPSATPTITPSATPSVTPPSDVPTKQPTPTVSPTPTPSAAGNIPVPSTPTGTPKPKQTAKKKLLKKGTVKKVGNAYYKVTKSSKKNGTVAFVRPAKKTYRKLTIPATVKISGYTYQVTSILDRAMNGCKKLTQIVVSSKKIKTVGKNSFKGISKKAVIKVPKSMKKKYKKLFTNRGQSPKVKIK